MSRLVMLCIHREAKIPQRIKKQKKILIDQCTSNSLLDVSQTETIVEDFYNLNYATQDDSSMLAACGHSFNSAPSSDYNFSADFSNFVNELLDAKTTKN